MVSRTHFGDGRFGHVLDGVRFGWGLLFGFEGRLSLRGAALSDVAITFEPECLLNQDFLLKRLIWITRQRYLLDVTVG